MFDSNGKSMLKIYCLAKVGNGADYRVWFLLLYLCEFSIKPSISFPLWDNNLFAKASIP